MIDWYQLSATEALEKLETDVSVGLSEAEVSRRREKYGMNELIEGGQKSPWQILWEQFSAPLVVMLIVAAAISTFLEDYKNAIAIMAIVILNAFLGFRQEYNAEQAMAALKKLATPTVKVRRDGQVQEVSSRDLVPGDIVLLEAGNLVPADGRLLESFNLRVQEAALTGESEPVEKEAEAAFETEQGLGDRLNMVYMGTTVTYGRSTIAIASTGMETELGHIANLIQTVDSEPTPLQKRLEQVGKTLGAIAVAIAGVIFILGILRGEDFKEMFLTAVSLVVAAVPEGLPAVVTIALALGANRMLKRNALIRKLPAVETLGSVTTICSDKTGTLTKNQMTVTTLDLVGQRFNFDSLGKSKENNPELTDPELTAPELINKPQVGLLLLSGALCNDSVLDSKGNSNNKEGTGNAIGDPTETALAVAGARIGLWKSDLERLFPRIAEVPFDSDRKRMTTLHQCPTDGAAIPYALASTWSWLQDNGAAPSVVFSKGAINSLLDISDRIWVGDRPEPLDKNWRDRIAAIHDELAQDGLRVLAIGFSPLDSNILPIGEQVSEQVSEQILESNLIFLGLVGIIDPARPEVKTAIATCQSAGIRPVMITGDHQLTARHIATELGITKSGGVMTGQALNSISTEELEKEVEGIGVFARVSPEHKLNIVQALKSRGHIVAMTGDGVNDAPALKKADIGVAMGITGTDVAKEASDMVLENDNFATIVAAVEEGRTIYDNIRKFIKYVLTGNGGELWVILFAPFWGMPLPLEPLQILWVNLIADGLLALALSVEPGESNVMQRSPYKPNESIFGRGMGIDIVWIALVLGIILLGVAIAYYDPEAPEQILMRTMVFSTLSFSRIGLALAIRSDRDSLWQIGLLSNKPMLAVVIVTFILQVALLYAPWLPGIFGTVALSAKNLAIVLGLSLAMFLAVEAKKFFLRLQTRD